MTNILGNIKSGKDVFGLYCGISDPNMALICALAGFDYIRLDCEHALINLETVANFIRSADAAGIPVHVRVPSLTHVSALLDFGASGIIVPDIQTPKDAREAVEAVKYAPIGARGMATLSRSLQFGEIPIRSRMQMANEEVCLAVQIESRSGLDHLDEIIAIEGIDMISSGKNDLSQALGVPGDNAHPEVIAAENKIITKALQYGKIPTLMVPNIKRAKELQKIGIHCFTIFYDTKFILEAFKNQVSLYRDALK